MATKEDILSWRGQNLQGSDGEKLGTIEEIYLDDETREPEWALITTGLFGTKQSFVPLREASPSGEGIGVPFDKATVKDAPKIDPDGQLSHDEEAELYRHYGLEYRERQTGSGPSHGDRTDDPLDAVEDRADDRPTTTDDAMTRSEEELHVGTH